MNPNGGVISGHGSRAEKESSCDERSLLDQVLESENLQRAWKQVKGNKGAPGIDEMSIEEFPSLIQTHGETILAKLRAGIYQPSPVKRIYIPKPDGTKRALGIPTVLDRVIQQAIAQVLTPIYEPSFSDSSHGFRPGRSAHGAVEQWQKQSNWRGPKCHVVDCDLKSFFDTVDHQKLMSRLRESIVDRRLLDLIGKYLKAGLVLPEGSYEETAEGVPQGGPLSPLLANILLDELDRELEARGHSFVRYADDFVILCSSPRAGRRILDNVRRHLHKRMKLVVNEAKSQVVQICDAAFLGFNILRGRVRWSAKSMARFKAKIRELTRRTRGVSPYKVTEDLHSYIRGAANYYIVGMNFAEAKQLDSWMRRRMRMYYWKQWKRPRTRRKRLMRLGIGREGV